MKNFLIVLCAAFVLAGCSGKEQTGLKEVLVAKFKDDQDLKDYKLDPEPVADCVVREIGSTLPGFAGDPRRDQYFAAYVRFFNVKSPSDAEKSIADFTELFGSAKKARDAATSVTEHIMNCMGKAIEGATSNNG